MAPSGACTEKGGSIGGGVLIPRVPQRGEDFGKHNRRLPSPKTLECSQNQAPSADELGNPSQASQRWSHVEGKYVGVPLPTVSPGSRFTPTNPLPARVFLSVKTSGDASEKALSSKCLAPIISQTGFLRVLLLLTGAFRARDLNLTWKFKVVEAQRPPSARG